MIYLTLVEPEIPQNTGNIARSCVATGSTLILIHPLGFSLSEKYLRRSAMDYWQDLKLEEYPSFDSFIEETGNKEIYFFSSRAEKTISNIYYPKDKDLYFIFGKESVGLDSTIIEKYKERTFRIPMKKGARCLNLSNSVAIVLYDALRFQGYRGLV